MNVIEVFPDKGNYKIISVFGTKDVFLQLHVAQHMSVEFEGIFPSKRCLYETL